MRIGIMGGSFDPIHNGHLYVAENAADFYKLDKVLFIPTGDTPHKNNDKMSDKKHRFNMAKLAVSGNENFDISSIETARETTCYTVDTVNILKEVYKDAEFFYIVGADVLADMGKWREPDKIFAALQIIAAGRNPDEISITAAAERLVKDYNAKIHMLGIPMTDVSSTDIRQRVAEGRTIKYMLPDAVADYIKNNRLYSKLP